MSAKLLMSVVTTVAAVLGFWCGSHRTARYYQDVVVGQALRNRGLEETRIRAQMNLKLLNELQEGQRAQAKETLERQLSVAVAGLGATWRNAPSNDIYWNDIFLIRDVHNYRSRYPWTNDPPQLLESIEAAYTLTDLFQD